MKLVFRLDPTVVTAVIITTAIRATISQGLRQAPSKDLRAVCAEGTCDSAGADGVIESGGGSTISFMVKPTKIAQALDDAGIGRRGQDNPLQAK